MQIPLPSWLGNSDCRRLDGQHRVLSFLLSFSFVAQHRQDYTLHLVVRSEETAVLSNSVLKHNCLGLFNICTKDQKYPTWRGGGGSQHVISKDFVIMTFSELITCALFFLHLREAFILTSLLADFQDRFLHDMLEIFFCSLFKGAQFCT